MQIIAQVFTVSVGEERMRHAAMHRELMLKASCLAIAQVDCKFSLDQFLKHWLLDR